MRNTSIIKKLVLMEKRKTTYSSNDNTEWIAKPLTEQQATAWVRKMKNADGSVGELITMTQAKDWLVKKGYSDIHLPDFYAIINSMKSDYCNVAKMFNLIGDDIYGELARAFIMDKDAKVNKASLYCKYIVM